jgi:hypothetical protein
MNPLLCDPGKTMLPKWNSGLSLGLRRLTSTENVDVRPFNFLCSQTYGFLIKMMLLLCCCTKVDRL